MSKQETTIVLELTQAEAAGLIALIGPTHGNLGFEVWEALWSVMPTKGYDPEYYKQIRTRFPGLFGTGVF